MKKGISAFLVLSMLVMLAAGCGADNGFSGKPSSNQGEIMKIGFVVNCVQLRGDPFQSAVWEGVEQFAAEQDGQARYLESKTEEDFLPNLDRITDGGYELIFSSGFQMAADVLKAAELNSEVHYVLIDHTFEEEELPENVTGVEFPSEISAFLVGYIAAQVSESGKIGFIGGISSEPLDRFEYGYRYGAAYAAEELEKEIEVKVDYTDSFQEALRGENLANNMYNSGCDVIFQAAGESGLGVFDAAIKKDQWVIGVDVDQFEEAPSNVLTSALKRVDTAAGIVAEAYASEEEIGGKNYFFGVEEKVVGLPEKNPNLEKYYPGLYEKTMKLEEQILSGEIVIPKDQDSFDALSKQE